VLNGEAFSSLHGAVVGLDYNLQNATLPTAPDAAYSEKCSFDFRLAHDAFVLLFQNLHFSIQTFLFTFPLSQCALPPKHPFSRLGPSKRSTMC
jgi:hypothetical protein